MSTITHGQRFSRLLDAFPTQFEFYHLGTVEQKTLDFSLNEDFTAVMYRIHGDIHATFLLFFEKSLDPSVYSELGNVLASRIVSQLHAQEGMDLMISPPKLLNPDQVAKILKGMSPAIRKTYAHFYKNSVIPVESVVLSALAEEIGYA